MFRPPLENIFGFGRPFLPRKEAGLALVKRSTERPPQVTERLRAIERAIDSPAVSPRIAVCDIFRDQGAAGVSRPQERKKSWRRNVSSRQRCAGVCHSTDLIAEGRE